MTDFTAIHQYFDGEPFIDDMSVTVSENGDPYCYLRVRSASGAVTIGGIGLFAMLADALAR